MPPVPKGERLGLAAVSLVALFLMLRPVLRAPASMALGSVDGEAPRHLWGLWATLAHIREYGPFVAHIDVDYPSGYTRHLMDPINLLPFTPGWLLGGGGPEGAALGFNVVHGAWVLVAALGTWLLARRLLGEHPEAASAALFAALAAATAPYLLASPYLGRTELLPGVLWPLHAWFLDRALQPGRRIGAIVGAGCSLAAMALGGWYLAGWLVVFEPLLALGLAWRATRRDTRSGWRLLGRLAVVALIAVLPVLPALQALLAWPPPILGEEQRVSVHMGINTPPQLLLPFFGNQGLPGVELSAYPGFVVSILAIWGALRHPRQALPWLLLSLLLIVVSLGPFLVWTNDARALVADPPRLPAWYLEKLLPPIRFIWGWCRLGILVTWPMAVAAAWGVADILRRSPGLRFQIGAVLAALLLADQARDRVPAGVMGRSFDARPPAELMEALVAVPPGAIVQLPLDDFTMVWQLAHGRPVAESLEIEDVRQQSFLVQQALAVVDQGHPERFTPPTPEDLTRAEALLAEILADPAVLACLHVEGARLAAAGWGAVVLHRDRLPDLHMALTRLLTEALGVPSWNSRDLAVWPLRRGDAAPGLECPLEKVEERIPEAEPVPAPPEGGG